MNVENRLPEKFSGSLNNRLRKASATQFEFFAGATETRMLHGRQRHGGVDKIPAPVYPHKRRQFAVRLQAAGVGEPRFKFYLRMAFGNIGVMCQHRQPQPLAFTAPVQYIGLIEQSLLRRHGGGNDVADIVQYISAITRTHELFCGFR